MWHGRCRNSLCVREETLAHPAILQENVEYVQFSTPQRSIEPIPASGGACAWQLDPHAPRFQHHSSLWLAANLEAHRCSMTENIRGKLEKGDNSIGRPFLYYGGGEETGLGEGGPRCDVRGLKPASCCPCIRQHSIPQKRFAEEEQKGWSLPGHIHAVVGTRSKRL